MLAVSAAIGTLVALMPSSNLAQSPAVTFGAATNFAVGAAPHSVAVGDFNRDGVRDLAVANDGGGTVSVLLGSTATPGSFSAATNYGVGTNPWSVAVEDFNRDGILDLAVANLGSNNVSVLLGSSTTPGSFGAANNFTVGTAPRWVAVGDLNRDGIVDIVTANATTDNVSVLLGSSTTPGSFGAATNFKVGSTVGDFPQSVAIGDVNRDGIPDLSVANANTNTVSVLLGSSTTPGSFGIATKFAVGAFPRSVAVDDVNKDGILDLVTANDNGNNVSVLLGSSATPGSFGAATNFAAATDPNVVLIGELNGDGIPDLAVSNYTSSNVSILLGSATTPGSFGAPTNVTVGTNPTSVAVEDLNADGRADIVTTNQNSTDVSVLLNTTTFSPRGGFGAAIDGTVATAPYKIAIGDVNRDGIPDLAVPHHENAVSILLGTGTGSLGAATTFAVGFGAESVAIGDLNGDGKPDLAVPNRGDNTVSILLGTGTGSFGAATNFIVGTAPVSVAIADLNRDGKPDLAVANLNDNAISILLGTGTGAFGAATSFASGNEPQSIAIGDLNRDGIPDLVTASYNSNASSMVSVLLGTGTGSFSAPTTFSAGASFHVAIGDLNSDGKLDLAVANYADNTVSVLLGVGDGSFGAATAFGADNTPTSVAIEDVNGDGKLDLVVANLNGSAVSVLMGDGDGFFGAPTNFAVGTGPWSVAIGDLNGDGKPDLAVGNYVSNTVSILLNTAPGPHITSISDTDVQVGSPLTITGTGFGATQGGSTVTIGGIAAGILSWSDTEIVAQVPAGAEGTNKEVSLTVNGQTSNSQTLSSVTPGITSIAISPTNPTIGGAGVTQAFTATATMTDSTMSVLSGRPELLGTTLFGDAGNQELPGKAGLIVNGDSLFLVGRHNGNQGLLLRYGLPVSGAPQWNVTLSATSEFNSLALAGSDLYPVGEAMPPLCGTSDGFGGTEHKTILARYTTAGTFVSCRSQNFFAYRGVELFLGAATATESGTPFIYAVGSGQEAGTGRTLLAKYNTAGTLLWKAKFGSGQGGGDGITVLNGFVYLAGHDRPGTANAQALLLKYDAAAQAVDSPENANESGTRTIVPAWTRFYDPGGGANAVGLSVANDGTNLYLIGYRDAGPFGGNDVFVRKYDQAGNLLWNKEWGGAGSDVGHWATAAGDRVYVVGETTSFGSGGQDAFLLELSAATGTVLSTQYWGGAANDFAREVVVDGSDLYVAAQTASFGAGGTDIAILRYSLPGLRWTSSMEGVATVSSTGLAAAVANGATTITAACKVVNCGPLASGVVSYWPGNGNANDISGTNHGSLQNGATFAAGKIGQALSFDGVDDHVRIADAASLDLTGPLTVEAWINPGSLEGGTFPTIVGKWAASDVAPNNSYILHLDSDGKVIFRVSPNGSDSGVFGVGSVISDSIAPLNQWTHVVGVHNGTHVQVFVNGVLDNQVSYTQGVFAGTHDLAIGANVGGVAAGESDAPFGGLIDEVAVYDRALSAEEIQALALGGHSDSTTLTVGGADLAITKTDSPDPVPVSTPVTYTITVTNNGPSDATGVTITDTLPAGATFVSGAPTSPNCTGPVEGQVICSIGDLANGASAQVTIAVTAPSTPRLMTNTASVSATESDPNTANNTDTETTVVRSATPTADLGLTQTDSPDPATVGQAVTYTLTVLNQGGDVATGVATTSTLPPGVTLNSASASQGTGCTGTSTITCALGTIDINSTATVTLVITPTQPGALAVTSTADEDNSTNDPNPTNNAASSQTIVGAATFTVNSTGDAADAAPGDNACLTATPGECTLRAAIQEANFTTAFDAIGFLIPGTGVQTITPTSALPQIDWPVVIDGYTQPGATPNSLAVGDNAALKIELNGTIAGAGTDGLLINASNTTIRGLVMNRFSGGDGIRVPAGGTSGVVIEGNFIGTNATGSAVAGFGNAGNGVNMLTGVSSGNRIGGSAPAARNLISGNGSSGVLLGASAANNLIEGNYIGTDVTGTVDLGNSLDGISLITPASNNTVRGNLISGNNRNGVVLSGASVTGNIVQGNFIGTNAAGTAAIANGLAGVNIQQAAANNTIGGSAASIRNVISGNVFVGVLITGVGTTGNVVQGNFIGTDAAGTAAIRNAGGVQISGAGGNTIGGKETTTPGGPCAGECNVISGNLGDGIQIAGTASTVNVVQGNFIGTNAAGTAAVANGSDGVFINGAGNNEIGGTTPKARNLISGNAQSGVRLSGSGTTGNVIQGNYIGTDAAGAVAVANAVHGVLIQEPNNTIDKNVISGNAQSGIAILSAGATGNTVKGNFIGTNAAGTGGLGNVEDGVRISGGANNNTIGGTTPASRNVISGNGTGVAIGPGGGNFVLGNFIGTNAAGTAAIPNTGGGVSILSSGVNIVGGTNTAAGTGCAGACNVISGNSGSGVSASFSADGNRIQGNFIGTKSNGTDPLPNGGDGIYIARSDNNLIGGTNAGERNVISGNSLAGIRLDAAGGTSANNQIQGNFIGTDLSGMLDRGNTLDGVLITGGATNNLIGGRNSGDRNVISGNNARGVSIEDAGTTGNLVQGNLIGTKANGTEALGNAEQGVRVGFGANGNTIGGTATGAANTIAFSGLAGVRVFEPGSIGNAIQTNAIFSNGLLGINLGVPVTVTPNDTNDGDSGPNNLQNFPVLTAATQSASTVISGTLNSTANTQFRVEFFSNSACDASGHGEGQTFLGFTNVTTNSDGNASFTSTVPTTVPVGHVITATATNNTTNDTSEFSACRAVAASAINQPPAVTPVSDQTVNEGQTLTFNVSASDADGNLLVLSADLSNTPGASFTQTASSPGSAMAQFSWTPNSAQSGTKFVNVVVNDGVDVTSEQIPIVVTETQADGDGDGVPDGTDNCPTVYNPDQSNIGGGPAGDVCENNPQGVTATTGDGQVSTQTGASAPPGGPIIVTTTITFHPIDFTKDSTADNYFVVIPNAYNVILQVIDNATQQPVEPEQIPEAGPVSVPHSLATIPANQDQAFQVEFNLDDWYPSGLPPGEYRITTQYTNVVNDPHMGPNGQCGPECIPNIWLGSAPGDSVVINTNQPPSAGDDTATTAEDSPVVINVLTNDSDPENDTLTITAVTQGAHGGVVINSGATSVTYTPAADYNSATADTFTYTISDGHNNSATASVSVTVTAVNDPPTFDPIADQTVSQNAGAQQVTITGVAPGPATATDESSQTVSMTATSSNPTVVPHPVISGTGASRTLTYQPAPNATGTVTITVTANDGQAENNTFNRTFTITVAGIERVSVSSAPANAQGNLASGSSTSAVSADGRYVAFVSLASNLVAGDTNNAADAFVRDRQTGETTLVSVSATGGPANGPSAALAISGDGRYVAFVSSASNLVAGDTNARADVFVRDRQTNTTTRVSISSLPTGTQGNNHSLLAAISTDGRYVAFSSTATNLVPGDTNARSDIFVHDRTTGQTTRVSVRTGGVQATGGDSSIPAISGDGRYVAFSSSATNLVPGDTNARSDIFVHDRTTGQTTRVSVKTGGTQAIGGDSTFPALSGDGRYVAFSSSATNLVSGDANARTDVFVHDRQSGETKLVSVTPDGIQGNDNSLLPAISGNREWVSFTSSANNLVTGDTNNALDVFARPNP